mgnify:CR=1 FL=1
MFKKVLALALVASFAVVAAQPSQASWLSKQWKKLEQSTASSSNDVVSGYHRWVQVSENQYFKTYVDKNSIEPSGEAQYRRVRATFKSEFTPIGSAWLGNTSQGEVAPDTITTHYYTAEYNVSSRGVLEWTGSNIVPSTYFDVHNNLIYKGMLNDVRYLFQATASYIPNSETEHIKAVLFGYQGWNY